MYFGSLAEGIGIGGARQAEWLWLQDMASRSFQDMASRFFSMKDHMCKKPRSNAKPMVPPTVRQTV